MKKRETFIQLNNGCLEWLGPTSGRGYGVLSFFKRNYYIHRLSYRLFIGEIPNGLFVCHKCDNPKCFSPDHLFLGTAKENVADMIKKGRAVRIPKGVFKGKRTYTNEDYVEMRKMKAKGFAIRDIRETFAISPAQLWRVLTNRTLN